MTEISRGNGYPLID